MFHCPMFLTDLETTVRGFKANAYDYYGNDLSTMIKVRLNSEFAKYKGGFSLAEVSMSNVSRREGKDKNNDGDKLD